MAPSSKPRLSARKATGINAWYVHLNLLPCLFYLTTFQVSFSLVLSSTARLLIVSMFGLLSQTVLLPSFFPSFSHSHRYSLAIRPGGSGYYHRSVSRRMPRVFAVAAPLCKWSSSLTLFLVIHRLYPSPIPCRVSLCLSC